MAVKTTIPSVIYVADDFGYSPTIDAAILELAAHGVLDGASVLVTGSGLDHVAKLRQIPQLQIGLHLSLTWGQPAAKSSGRSGLVDSEGRFHGLPRFVFRVVSGRISIAELRAEIEAQFDRLAECAGRVDFVDGHEHVHFLPPVFEALNDVLGTQESPRRRIRFGRMGNGGLVRRGLINSLVSYQDLRRRLGKVEFHFQTTSALVDFADCDEHAVGGSTEAMLHLAHPDLPDASLSDAPYDFENRVAQFRRMQRKSKAKP
jgi:predicted glycoside hydrolase/deacetylase ChbG (UPF0249 family)